MIWYIEHMRQRKNLYTLPASTISFIIHDEEATPLKHPSDAFLREYFKKVYDNFETRLARLKHAEPITRTKENELTETLHKLIEAKRMTEEE